MKKPKTPPKPRKLAPRSGDPAAATPPSPAPEPAKTKTVSRGDRFGSQARTTALRTASADGKSIGDTVRADHYEAWREIQLQQQQIDQLEDTLQGLCRNLGLNHIQVLSRVDATVTAMISRKK